MVKTMKKVFSILTVLCMMMGILSITAFAADDNSVTLTYHKIEYNKESTSNTFNFSVPSEFPIGRDLTCNCILVKQATGAIYFVEPTAYSSL